jgi:hypothetical protein
MIDKNVIKRMNSNARLSGLWSQELTKSLGIQRDYPNSVFVPNISALSTSTSPDERQYLAPSLRWIRQTGIASLYGEIRRTGVK